MKLIKVAIIIIIFTFTPFVVLAAEKGGIAPHMTWRIIDFIVFAAGIYYFLKNPIATYFKNRKEEIKNSFEEAERLKKEAEVLLKETEEKMKKLNAEIDKIVKTFKSIAEQEKESIMKETENIIARIRESIEEERVSLMNKARLELLKKMTQKAIEDLREKLSGLSKDQHTKINKKIIGSITQ